MPLTNIIAMMCITLFWVVIAGQMSHPISLALILLALAINFGVVVFKAHISWFFYILVLVFLGGVMVVVMYMTSLAANEKIIKPQLNGLMAGLGVLGLLCLTPRLTLSNQAVSSYKFVGVLYTEMGGGLLVFCALALLISMLAVVKIIKLESGPLVKSF